MTWILMSDSYIIKSQQNLQLLLTMAFCDRPNTPKIKINLLQENADSLHYINVQWRIQSLRPHYSSILTLSCVD